MTETEEEQIRREHDERIERERGSYGRLALWILVAGCIFSGLFIYLALRFAR